MRTLLLHDITPDAEPADALRAAGHEIVRCTGPDERTFPCVGITTGRCPLDGTVDVAVVVHDKPTTGFASGEAGVVCALRDRVPLVVAGNHTFSPFVELADAVADDVDDLDAACRRAVTAAACRDADAIGAAAGCDATVERRGGVVRVVLAGEASEKAGVLAHQEASRRFPHVRVIDVLR
jgi:hypothetical protein